MKYLLRRIGFYAVAGWASLTLAFFVPRLMPGDPATALFARFHGKLKPEAIEALSNALGLSKDPVWKQYFVYLGHVLRGDLGVSISHFPAKVADVIGVALGWTVLLTGIAVIISFVVGTLLGVYASWKRNGALDRIAPPLLTFLSAFPYFWLAMVALYVFGLLMGAFPMRHAYADYLAPAVSFEFLWSVAGHAVLPAATVVVATLGGWMLGMRSTMVAVMGEDYITLAHAKGLSPNRVMFRYAARNALLPNVTSFGMALGFVLSGSLLTEVIFSYPGTGYLLLQAVHSLDYPLLQGLFLTITFAVLAANFLVDVVYVALDPRAR